MPIAASEAAGTTDLNQLAAKFGKPVMALYSSGLSLQKATLFDTAFRGGYARRLTLAYAFSDGAVITVESIRPTAAVSLLSDKRYRLNVDSLYTPSQGWKPCAWTPTRRSACSPAAPKRPTRCTAPLPTRRPERADQADDADGAFRLIRRVRPNRKTDRPSSGPRARL